MKRLFKLILIPFTRSLKYLFIFVPLKKNRIIFHVHERKGLTCNPKYLMNELLSNSPNDYEIIWVTNYPCTITNNDIKVVKINSLQFLLYYYTSKIIVTNDFISGFFSKRKGQVFINTWHGAVGYKKIGLAVTNKLDLFDRLMFNFRHKKTDYVISGSESFTNHMQYSLGLDKKAFKSFGSPRNDIFFKENTEIIDSINLKYSLNKDDNVLLYAPSFSDLKTTKVNINFELLLNVLKVKFGGNWTIFYRSHYFDKTSIKSPLIKDVSDYHDIQELLVRSKVLITDYSSSIWDFSITMKPSFIYAPDYINYNKMDRGFYLPLEEWPYSFSSDIETLFDNIKLFDQSIYEKKIIQHHKKLGNFSKGNSSRLTVDFILEMSV